ncbi:hypothetical protein [Gynuella sp.]|uniref:hypothetical protein n=1 Tax=Gynuella sp. TaxID=2969146 RepID=UPI003D12E104
MKSHIATQNYKMACGLSAAMSAVDHLQKHDVEILEVGIKDGNAYIISSDARTCPDIKIVSEYRALGFIRYRAELCGCLVQWQENYLTDGDAA